MVAALREHRPGTSILHWYSGSLKTLRAAAEAGAYFSVNSAMIRSERGRRVIQEMPRDRLLTESDGPFITDGDTPASPSQVRITVTDLAELWALDPPAVQRTIYQNFCNLLKVGDTPIAQRPPARS